MVLAKFWSKSRVKSLLILSVLLTACSQVPEFKSFPKIDSHVHLDTSDDSFMEQVLDNNFILISLVTKSGSSTEIEQEFEYVENLQEAYPGSVEFATTFSMDGFGEPDWEENTMEWLRESVDRGAIAVKVWKDIGMTFRDKDGSFILIDDKRLDPVWDFIESEDLTLVNHNGEPKNCWLPIDSMTVNGDQRYFSEHPEYHMYKHPDYPSYEELLAARDHMLDKHPDLRYVGCHLGSMEWNTDKQAQFLDRYPNAALDMAARITHFKVQDRDKVRDFIIEYQDRLLYGTDVILRDANMEGSSSELFQKKLRNVYQKDWAYFTKDEVFTQNNKVKQYRGLDLPVAVLEKIYYKNTLFMYPGMAH